MITTSNAISVYPVQQAALMQIRIAATATATATLVLTNRLAQLYADEVKK